MDSNGYPDVEELTKIKEWPYKDCTGLMAYVESLWRNPDWGWKRDGNTYAISTGGWSGNEDLINAMGDNLLFWALCWVESKRGGHYTFEIPI